MSRPRDIGEMSFQLHGERQRRLIQVQNIGARKPVSEQPVHLHFIDVNGRVREGLHDIFKFRPGEEPPIARIVAFRQFAIEILEDDQMLVRIRRGIIEAAIFAQRINTCMHQHHQLITFFMATLMKQALCECGCNEGSLRTRHSQSLKERVNQLLHGVIINNGAYLKWDTSEDGSEAAEFRKLKAKIKGVPYDPDLDEDNPLSEEDFQNMRRFSGRFSDEVDPKRSPLQKSTAMFNWNKGTAGTLSEYAAEPNDDRIPKIIERAIRERLYKEAA